jgi:hypothetical protein
MRPLQHSEGCGLTLIHKCGVKDDLWLERETLGELRQGVQLITIFVMSYFH